LKTKAFYLYTLSVLSIGCWLYVGSLLSSRGPDWLVALAIAAWLFISTLALAATRVRHRAWIYAALLVLAVFSLLPFVLAHFFTNGMSSLGFGLFALSYPIAVLITMLLYIGLDYKAWQGAGVDEDSQAERKQSEWTVVIPVLSALTLVWWLFVGFMWGGRFGSIGWWLIALAIVLLSVSALVLAARRASRKVWVLAALLILMSLSLPASLLLGLFRPQGLEPFSSQQVIVLLLMLSASLVTVALLLHSGLRLLDEWRNTGALGGGDSQARRKRVGKTASLVFALGSFLLAKALHNLYWFTVWDATTDSLGYLWLAIPVPAVLLSGAVLCIVLPGRTKLTGFLYSLLIPALMIGISARAQRVDFHQLTEERAERITQAIEAYYAREGRYPQNLQQLTPWYILSLPGPVILYGQDWCYVGGEDYYRLGYLDRENWSSPILFGWVHSAKGRSPLEADVCQSAIDTYRAEHPDWDWLQYLGSPTPTPDIGD
jgi:hypothetical protein